MKNINKIFWQKDKIGLLANHLDAEPHSHWMQQLFLGLEDNIAITINGCYIQCDCIVVDKNIPHSFSAGNKVCYSALIEPVSSYVQQLAANMAANGYWLCDSRGGIEELRRQGTALAQQSGLELYSEFAGQLDSYLGICAKPNHYDERIAGLLHLLDSCDCNSHSVSNFADQMALSSSRLSHLFREQVGIPLKGYILLHQMERAFRDLFAGKNITGAAMSAGFDSPSHFAGTVKRMMGMSVSFSLKDSEFLKVY